MFTPNGVPVLQHNFYRNESLRLTWQATPRNKFTISIDKENNCVCNSNSANLFGATNPVVAEEASQGGHYDPNNIYQATWTRPFNSKLLFEAGADVLPSQLAFLLAEGCGNERNLRNRHRTRLDLSCAGLVCTAQCLSRSKTAGLRRRTSQDPTTTRLACLRCTDLRFDYDLQPSGARLHV